MAIQISPKLLDEITAHIHELAKTAIRTEFGSANDEIPLYINGKDSKLIDLMTWGEHLHLRDKIPRHWCERIDYGSESYRKTRLKIKLAAYPKFTDNQFCLVCHGEKQDYYAPPNWNAYSYILNLNKSKSIGPFAELYENVMARAKVTTRWIETQAKVDEFLKTCRSLNQAVKLWPELAHLIPTERRKRLEEENAPKSKKERTTPAPEEVLGQINRDSIAGDLVALRFATA